MDLDGSVESDDSQFQMEPLVDFWGVELSSKQKRLQWPKSEDELDPDIVMRLELRNACLGAKAKLDERNVVEVTAEDENGQEVTHSIASLTVGGSEQSPLFLELFPPVNFSLAAGTGPLHLVGTVHTEYDATFSEGADDEEEEEEEEESLTSPDLKKARKRPALSPPAKPQKLPKLGENGQESEEDSEEEEEEESSEEEEEEQQKPVKKTPSKPALASSIKSKSAQKPQRPEASKVQFKTPQPVKVKKSGTKPAPTTPEQGKGQKKSTKPAIGLQEMKEKLQKTSNLPKKLDKFSNYVQHNFKVTDDQMKKQLWEHVQKLRGGK